MFRLKMNLRSIVDMPDALSKITASQDDTRTSMTDRELVEGFKDDPERAYVVLLERYTPVLLRMIRRFMRDPDEVMEVYTAICERFRANDFQALRRFHSNSELTPWLSVVAANACRDRFRKNRASSTPRSVLKKLDERERLIFKYFYQERLPHEDISEIVSSKHGVACSPLEVVRAIEKINELLSVKKRWLLLSALNSNRPALSVDELAENGFELSSRPEAHGDATQDRALMRRLNEALETLSGEDQLLVMLRYEQEMTAVQIAKVLHYDCHKYVYTRLRTITGQLRRHMEGSGKK